MSVVEQFNQNLDAISAMMGIPHGSFTFIFAGPPKLSQFAAQLADGEIVTEVNDNVLVPIGGVITVNIQGNRSATSQKFLGTQMSVPLPAQGTPETGMLQGLLLFSNYNEQVGNNTSLQALGDIHRWHLLKKMYANMILNTPKLVSFFYKKGQGDIGLVPVAYDDSDKWRNFARSTLYDFPIGLYVISKSQMGETLEASYYEGVRVQGSQSFMISAVNQTPVYEQVMFTYVNMEPVDPNIILSTEGSGSMGEFVSLAREYLGVNY
jgi:hypothetical protein